MAEEAKWYVVHTYSGYESKVAATILQTVENRKLHDYISEVSIPTETVQEIKNSKTVEREHNMFPGYVLVKMVMNDDSWHIVRNIRGVTGFVGPGGKPVALTDEEVASLGVEQKQLTVDYHTGDSVRIIDGSLDGFIGTVEEVSPEKNKVRVTISMFGRDTPVELELDQVEPI